MSIRVPRQDDYDNTTLRAPGWESDGSLPLLDARWWILKAVWACEKVQYYPVPQAPQTKPKRKIVRHLRTRRG